jgi:hypothetical protein
MAIKRWNASTSQWELVGTPGTASPSAIGAAGLVGGNTLTGRQTVSGGASGIDIESTSLIRSKNGFRVTGNNGANEYQIGPFYNFTDFQITSSTNNFASHLKRFEINTTGSSILGEAAASTYNPDSSFNRVLAVQQSDQVLTMGSYWQAGVGQNSYINSSQSTSRTNASNLFFQTGGVNRFLIEGNGNVQIFNNGVDTLRYFDIYNTNSGNSAGTIIRLITNNAANSAVTTVDMVKYRNGYFGILNNDSAGSIGFGTGGTERMRVLSTGAVVVGSTSLLNNETFGVKATANTQNLWLDTTDPNYSTVVFGNRVTRANTSAYTFLQNWSGAGSDTEHYLRGDGQAFADGSWNGGGADYAEYFEWADGNTNNEDRRGYSVSLINDKIKIAEEGDTVFGVVSGNPSVVGDDAPMKWAGKYLKDDFGSYIRDEDGYRVLNPEYDEEAEYVSRESRPEWSTIGLMGKLRLRKGQIVSPSWIKMKDISEQVEEWLVK